MPETPDEVRELCRLAAGRGYRAVKFGWGPLGRSPDLDRALVSAARAELGPDRELFVDGGQCWDVDGAVRAAATFAELGVGWLEEPLPPDDLEGYAALAARSAIPIAAGEQCEGTDEFVALAATGVGVLQPDISRCGGYTVARRVARLAEERGIECIPHLYSTGVLTAASLHFVASSRARAHERAVGGRLAAGQRPADDPLRGRGRRGRGARRARPGHRARRGRRRPLPRGVSPAAVRRL